MTNEKTAFAAHGATALFVLLWSSGAIVSKWGLAYASPFAFLILRFSLALLALLALARAAGHPWLPERGARTHSVAAGLAMMGGYSACYFLALDSGLTPGVLATALGAQPLLTLALVERRFGWRRMAGLMLALTGLVLVMWDGIEAARFSIIGMLYAAGALLCMTGGAILQKSLRQPPLRALPLQYLAGLMLCVALAPWQPWQATLGAGLLATLLWLGLVISVGATLLLYRLIQAGNLVNVTSLFYLVPGGTALLDYLLLGNPLAPLAMAAMALILAGLALVLRSAP